MDNVGTLLERMKDDNATFTSAEVSAMLDYVRERACKDYYINSKLVEDMRLAREMAERSLELQECFEAKRLEHATHEPYTLRVVVDDGSN